jgi:geranylgeranyl reductase family protein
MLDFDVVVVGGGPAGATAARSLGLKGVRTLLIDKKRFPRDKACGGGISARLFSRFPYLEQQLGGIPVNWIHRVYLKSPAGFSVEHVSDRPLYLMVRRFEFDNMLFRLAAPLVTTLEDGLVKDVSIGDESVRIRLQGGRCYTANLVIGADGANSIVARFTGLRTRAPKEEYAIDMMEETPYELLDVGRKDTMYVYYGVGGHYGYGYVFPKTCHLNVGVGYKLDYYLATFQESHYVHQANFIESLRKDGVVRGASSRKHFMAFPIPVSGPLPRTYGHRVLLCGDAGGFVNAFTAEGIFHAMVTGEYAAKAAALAVMRNDYSSKLLSSFETMWQREIGLELTKSVKIQRWLLSKQSRIDRIVNAAKKSPILTKLLAEYSTGTIGYREFKRAVILKALPFYIAEKFKKLFWWT